MLASGECWRRRSGDDLTKTASFYQNLFERRADAGDRTPRRIRRRGRDRSAAFSAGRSRQPLQTSGGLIPAHDGSGPAHFALAVDHSRPDRLGGSARGARHCCREPGEMGGRRARALFVIRTAGPWSLRRPIPGRHADRTPEPLNLEPGTFQPCCLLGGAYTAVIAQGNQPLSNSARTRRPTADPDGMALDSPNRRTGP